MALRVSLYSAMEPARNNKEKSIPIAPMILKPQGLISRPRSADGGTANPIKTNKIPPMNGSKAARPLEADLHGVERDVIIHFLEKLPFLSVRRQLPQNILQNPAVFEISDLLRGVDAN